jgi:hypothetical protein
MLARLQAWAAAHDAALRDILTGIMLVIALGLLLNRGLFGLETGEGWTVSYGNF